MQDCSPLEQRVAEQILYRSGYTTIESYLEDLTRCGCVSGMVSELIYYTGTYAFFDEFYDEIEEMRIDYEESVGEPLRIKHNLKNDLAWFAFEETALRIGCDVLGLEL